MAKILLVEFVDRSDPSYTSPLSKKVTADLQKERNDHAVTHLEVYTPEEAKTALQLFQRRKFDAIIIANHGALNMSKAMGEPVADAQTFANKVLTSSQNNPVIIYDESHQSLETNRFFPVTVIEKPLFNATDVCNAVNKQLESRTKSA